jgi:hypothetical protein
VRRLTFPFSRRIPSPHYAALRDLTELTRVQTWYNELNDDGVLQWQNLPKLAFVEVGTSRLTPAGCRHLANFPNIHTLNLNLAHCNDAGLESFAGLTRLKVLGLMGTQVTNKGLKHLTSLSSLHELSLDKTAVGDSAVEDLGKLKSLKRLSITDTAITAKGAAALREALPGCEVIGPKSPPGRSENAPAR